VSTARISLPERYRVVRHVANGGMASVWEAQDELLGRAVAVKLLASHLSEDDRARERFQREARAAASVSSHPNVVTVYDVGEHDGRTFMVMELLPGGTVADKLRSGEKIPPKTALRWLEEAASALDAAHAAGIVHRDVKPANMLLDDHGRLAIADFGIARLALEDQLTATGTVLGTAAYISPEQAAGDGATAASDRYALAVVAFELLTGERPFQADNFAAQARAHVEDPPPHASELNPALPPAVDAVLERGLAKDPADRWTSSDEFLKALEGALMETPEPTPHTETTRLAGRRTARTAPPVAAAATDEHFEGAPARRGRGSGALLALLAGLVALAVLVVILLSSGGSDPTAGRGTPTPQAAKKKATATPTAAATQTATAAAPAQTATPSATTAPSGTPNLTKARQLQIAGFNARNGGDYAKDLQLAQQAIDACAGSRAMDPCGYAMFEKGVSLSKLGRYDEAVTVLQQRLDQFGDNPKGEVAKELNTAKKKAGKG
jgi:tRNA A-37 threonylcarbamoyl transferase component Bud32